MALTSLGFRVVMTEEYDWIGGQLTSQAVPPDEHPWIEQFGCTRRYRIYRKLVRRYYRDFTPLTAAARSERQLNPGGGWVSHLCHEPRVGWMVLNQMLHEAMQAGKLDLRLRTKPIGVELAGSDHLRSVRFQETDSGGEFSVEAEFVLDATELGDLLPISGAEYVTGAESKSDTGEPHAIDGGAEPENVQGITWVMALGVGDKGSSPIDRPKDYDFWRSYQPDFWPDKLLSFKMLHVQKGIPIDFPLFGNGTFNLFKYRQIVDPGKYDQKVAAATIANWPQNDYYLENIIDVPAQAVAERLEQSRQLSLSLLYWLQTEAPRHDGGVGYPEIQLRPDLVGTRDGLAQAPYIRESRRIKAMFTVLEQHVSSDANPGKDRAPDFKDSVGVGSYRIDLHPSTNGCNTLDMATLPFQIPLGALIPVRVKNLIPACKNLGVTHITNGCYRLHPVEWNIGESAGLLAAHCIVRSQNPVEIWNSPTSVEEFQSLCTDQGIEIAWPQLRSL